MSRKYVLYRGAVAFFALCFVFSVLFAVVTGMQNVRAAEEDTVTVGGVSVEWDGNGNNHDLVTLTLNGAAFASNTDSNSHWEYFAPYIYVNGTAITGNVAWAIEGRYTATSNFCFYLNQNILKQDGSDLIEIREGCKIPLGDGADYYVVSETASFVAPVNAQNTGTETFVKGSAVTVGGVSVEWDGNGGGNDLVILTLDGAAFESNLTSNTHRHEIESHIFVNGTAISGVAWAIEGRYTNPKHYCFYLPQDVLKQDGTDIIEVRRGCHIPHNDGESYYLVTENAVYLSSGTSLSGQTETFAKQFIWETGKKYDIGADVLKAASAGNIGEYETKGVTLGSGHESWGLTGGDAYTQGLAIGDYAVFEFTKAVETSLAKSLIAEVKYDAKALFYIYPLDTQALTYENAVQSFRTSGSGINSLTISLESLAKEGSCSGFIVQLIDGDSLQFFLDSIALSTESFNPGEVEEVVKFEWKADTKIDIDASVIKTNGAGKIGEYETEGIALGSGHSDWGLTGDGFANTQILSEGDYFVIEFVLPIENTSIKSFSLEILNNASACFYVYPLGTTELGYDSAVQSFRTSNGLSTVELSATELFKDGVFRGFIVQAMTDSGVQFFLDSITLSEKTVQAEVEDLTEPEYATATVSIVEVSYTYRYEGGYDDLLLITFDQNIFNKTSDKGLNNERVGLDDFAEFLLINGISVSESGIGDYALRSMWERHDRLGVFIKSGSTGSLNNDAFDKITFAKGFAIRGSTGDYTMYTLAQDAVFYTNRALESGTQVTMSAESDPQIDQSLTPLLVTWKVTGGTATISITFDKTVRMEGSDFTENILRYIQVDGKALSEWGSEVTVSFDAMTIELSFATTLAADADVRITIEKGMNVQTNPDEALLLKTVQTTANFVRGENKENYFFAQGGTLHVYWATSPEAMAAENEEDTGFVTFDLRLSVKNAVLENFSSSVLKNILIGGDDLLKILTDESGASATLSGYTLSIKIPASYIAKGLVITVKKGFTTPAGGQLSADESFFYDEIFKEFNGEVHREEIESILKLTDVNTILTATDGVAPGTNQLFIEFTTPCSTKYLPFMQADAETIFASYGSVGITMPALYVYELNRYGMRDSLWDYFLIDGKTLREWAVADGGADASRYIDIYYQGTNFGVYYMQLVINAQSSAVMDWSESHTITFKEGFITPAFGVFDKDVQFAWDPETKTWAPDASANATVDPNAHLKDEVGEVVVTFGGGCSGFAAGTGTIFGALLVTGAVAALAVRKKRGAKGTETGKKGE